MRTQSADTHPDVERVLIEMIRKAPIEKRFSLVQSMTRSGIWTNVGAWRNIHQQASEREAAVNFASFAYGPVLAQYVQTALEEREDWHLQPVDLIGVMLPALKAFQVTGTTYYLGGSIASSLYGMQQLAQDIDLVVNLANDVLPALVDLFRVDYVVDESALHKAICQHSSFSLIHLDSLMKIDVILPGLGDFDSVMYRYVTQHTLDKRCQPLLIASASEMILLKLYRYHQDKQSRNDGMEKDAEWNDVLGMLKVQAPYLNLALLEWWAEQFEMCDSWQCLLVDTGLHDV